VYRREVFDQTARYWTEKFANVGRIIEDATEETAPSQGVAENTIEDWELI